MCLDGVRHCESRSIAEWSQNTLVSSSVGRYLSSLRWLAGNPERGRERFKELDIDSEKENKTLVVKMINLNWSALFFGVFSHSVYFFPNLFLIIDDQCKSVCM